MLRTISSPRLSPRFSLPCPREQSIGKIPPAGELVCRSARTFRVGEGGGNETERERERNVKRITDRDTGKNSSQKSRRWIVRAVIPSCIFHKDDAFLRLRMFNFSEELEYRCGSITRNRSNRCTIVDRVSFLFFFFFPFFSFLSSFRELLQDKYLF